MTKPAHERLHALAAAHVDLRTATTTIAETYPRWLGSANVSFLVSGRLFLQEIEIPANKVLTSIAFYSGATGATTPANQWFALFDTGLNLLKQTVDDTTTAWAAGTKKTLALTSTYTTGIADLSYYLGIMVNAATPPTLDGLSFRDTLLIADAPTLSGNSTTGLTTTAPNPAAAITVGATAFPYARII